MADVDEGLATMPPVLLLHGELSWSYLNFLQDDSPTEIVDTLVRSLHCRLRPQSRGLLQRCRFPAMTRC